VFRKNFSAQVLKANMRVVGNCEYGLILYRDKLPKFNNEGKMVFNCLEWEKDSDTPKIHPTQKPIKLLERLIRIFTDEGDVVIDPVAGSGSTLLAAMNCGRRAFGFEIKKDFHADATRLLERRKTELEEISQLGFSPTQIGGGNPTLFDAVLEHALTLNP
jgi:site-specific DNA-methyltransferase (adenine-specific)